MKTELHRLVLLDDEDELTEYLSVPQNRENLDVGDVMGWTPLHWCCSRDLINSARVLLEHGADPDAANDDGWTPAHDAARCGNKAMLDLLKQHGAKLSNCTSNGTTPLHYCVQYGHTKAVNWMTHMWDEGRKEINRPNVQGWTPLHFSARYGRTEVARELVESGANAYIKDKQDRHPRATAEDAIARIKSGNLQLTKAAHADAVTLEDYQKVGELILQAEQDQSHKCRMLAQSAVTNADLALEGGDKEEAIGHLRIASENYKLVELDEEAKTIDSQIKQLSQQLAMMDSAG